jgi:hypothetical protein
MGNVDITVYVRRELSGSHGDEYEDGFCWDVAPCSLVKVDRRFRGAYCLHRLDDGGSKYLWKDGQFLSD